MPLLLHVHMSIEWMSHQEVQNKRKRRLIKGHSLLTDTPRAVLVPAKCQFSQSSLELLIWHPLEIKVNWVMIMIN